MSNWGAIEKDGEAISAWEFRALYLRDGTKYDEFLCPFCDVKLAAILVYTDGEISKSPHFSAKWDKHAHGCDGEPIEVDAQKSKRPESHYIPREMHFPEAFTDRPPPRKQRPKGLENDIPPPTSIEVLTRRRHAGSLGKPVPRTYLLQPIVEAYNSIWSKGYELAEKEKWSEEERLQWSKGCPAAMPLRLEDNTNYGDAFRPPVYVHRNLPRIYHAAGMVTRQDGRYQIEGSFSSKKPTPVQCRVVIDLRMVSEASPKSHRVLLEELEAFANGKQKVRWYAYATPTTADNSFRISVENPDYLYVKRRFPKTKP